MQSDRILTVLSAVVLLGWFLNSCGTGGATGETDVTTIDTVVDSSGKDTGSSIPCSSAADCEDSNPCTKGVCAADGKCQHVPQVGEGCDDGNECTTGDYCNDEAVCVGQENVICDDGNACTKDTCSPAQGCEHESAEDGTECEDGTLCTSNDTCLMGVCVGGDIVQCDDGGLGGCTYKACNPVTGLCDKPEVLPEGSPCSDGNPCTDGDVCDDLGGCVPGAEHECHAQNPCQKSWCNENAAEGTNPCDWGWKEEGDLCDDNDLCTDKDKCVAGDGDSLKCTGDPQNCDDDNPCTSDACDEDIGCVFVTLADATPCESSEDPCAVAGKCEAGECVGATGNKCADDNPCTDDGCVPETGECTYEYNTAACDDGDACTSGDQCAQGACAGTVVDCSGLENPCFEGVCNPDTGECDLPVEDGLLCSDGDFCNGVETCASGVCSAGEPVLCEDDGNDCTLDICDSLLEQCGVPADDGIPCGDVDVCDGGASCQSGQCLPGTPIVCEDDGNPCTEDVCNPENSECGIAVADGGDCEDGDLCTGGDSCQAGVCTPGEAVPCDDANVCTDDSCAPDTGCEFVPNELDCQDGDQCTIADICVGGECVAGPALDCSDGNECTANTCDSVEGCVVANIDNGISCGQLEGWTCLEGECHCQLQCDGKECGPDGCGGDCGACEAGFACSEEGLCGESCSPNCGGIACGPDGCGGSCGDCGGGAACISGQCELLVTECGGVQCPELEGYFITCNSKLHCEYTNETAIGPNLWDIWIYISPGTFQMGSEGEGGGSKEMPVHQVTFNYGYFISKYEIVVEQYEACNAAQPAKCTTPSTVGFDAEGWGTNYWEDGQDPANSSNVFHKRLEHPQNGLVWQQASDFCNWVAPGGRLPSEAEWEYAATGPVHMVYPWGDSPEPKCANETAVFNEEGDSDGWGCGTKGTWPVGSKTAGSSWCGALDMSGNVHEWNEDWYHGGYASAPDDGSPQSDPGAGNRVFRGGSLLSPALNLRSSARAGYVPTDKGAHYGARCVRPETECIPACDGKDCGDDGCGGSCGDCSCGESCESGQCVFDACDGKACGDDGCGGDCGQCEDGYACDGGECICEGAPALVADVKYGGTNIDVVDDMAVIDAGGYILAGTTRSHHPSGDREMWLVRIDDSGGVVWEGAYGGSGEHTCNAVVPTFDGGFACVGDRFVGGASNYDVWLTRVDSAGNLLWEKSFGGSAEDRGKALWLASDGSLLAGGWTKSQGSGASDYWLIKTNASGDLIWDKTFGGGGSDELEAIAQGENSLVLFGTTTSSGAGMEDFWLVGTDADGSILWTKTYGGAKSEYATDVISYPSGGFALAGYTNSFGAGNWDFYVVSTDASGSEDWSQTFGHGGWDMAEALAVTTDGGLAVFGGREMNFAPSAKLWLVRTDPVGATLWDAFYDGYKYDYAGAAAALDDGSFALAGHATSDIDGSAEGWFGLTAPECTPCEPDCAGKECGPDGCTGNCGSCSDGLYCFGGECTECDDGNDISWDGCDEGKIVEFQVNSHTIDDQQAPAVATFADGGFIIVWKSKEQDGDSVGVFGQRYGVDGFEDGAEFQINTNTASTQEDPWVATFGAGKFVSVWESWNGSTQWDVAGQVFNSDGSKYGAEFFLGGYTSSDQETPRVAGISGDGFIAAWKSKGEDGDNWAAIARRFDAAGDPIGSGFVVNTYTPGYQTNTVVGTYPVGQFVIGWSGKGPGFLNGVFGQRYAADGSPTGSQFEVDSGGGEPDVTVLADGRVLFVWTESKVCAFQKAVYGQLLTASGAKLGEHFEISGSNGGGIPSVAALDTGGFVVVFEGVDGNGDGVLQRLYDQSGDYIGGEFKVHEYDTGKQGLPRVASFDNGGYIIVWHSPNQDGNGFGIFAQRYDSDGQKLYH